MAGVAGLEPATPGFGDRCATNCATPLGCTAQCSLGFVQRRALSLLFGVIATALAALGVYALLSGGRAVIVGVAALGLAVWMADLARRAWPRRAAK